MKQQFAATLKGKAINWFKQYGSFPTTVALQSAFLGRFIKEKTPNIRKKLEKLRQRDLLVEEIG